MSKKHNTKHQRSTSSYGAKVKQDGPQHLSDPVLSDGRRASVKR
jgi:hypothetical protein